jgi:hypothetical protein
LYELSDVNGPEPLVDGVAAVHGRAFYPVVEEDIQNFSFYKHAEWGPTGGDEN